MIGNNPFFLGKSQADVNSRQKKAETLDVRKNFFAFPLFCWMPDFPHAAS